MEPKKPKLATLPFRERCAARLQEVLANLNAAAQAAQDRQSSDHKVAGARRNSLANVSGGELRDGGEDQGNR
jgi:hypothetical protein